MGKGDDLTREQRDEERAERRLGIPRTLPHRRKKQPSQKKLEAAPNTSYRCAAEDTDVADAFLHFVDKNTTAGARQSVIMYDDQDHGGRGWWEADCPGD